MTTWPTTKPRTITTPANAGRMHSFSVRMSSMARPIAGRRLFPLYGVIRYIGHTSGTEYSTPVVVRPAADGVYVPLRFGEGTHWYRNALAAGGVRVTWKGRDHRMTNPTIADFETAGEGFTRAMRGMMRMSRVTQVVRFDPIIDEH